MLNRPLRADSVFLDATVGLEGMRPVVSSGLYGTVNPILARYWRGLFGTRVDGHIHSSPDVRADWHQFGGLLAQVISGVGQDVATNSRGLLRLVQVQDAQRIGVECEFLNGTAR
jgi:hypothetical protein